MAPRPATDPKRWSQISGGRNIRRQPKQSSMQKMLGMLPMGGKSAPAPRGGRGGKAGKAAMLSAAAGFAYKNRSKIGSLLGKSRGGRQQRSV